MNERKVILYIAMSLDGYIARPDGDISWLSLVEQKGEDYGYGEFISTVDTVIIGRKTYDTVLRFGVPFPHSDKKCFVITRTNRPSENNVTFYTKGMDELIAGLREIDGTNIFVDGGAEIVHELLRLELIDEYIISIIPVMLGSGIRLFNDHHPEQRLRSTSIKKFASGLVQLHYAVVH
ncbi:MAG: dihydrofolate reductase family protein [Bacteroidota bacterium]|jgi:dihydrofolate reductase